MVKILICLKMLLIFSTLLKMRHLLQINILIFLHRCLLCNVLVHFTGLDLYVVTCKDCAILAPKLADPPFWWKSNSTPSKTGSGYLIWIDSYVVLFIDVCYSKYSYLETRSRCVNKSFMTSVCLYISISMVV